MRTSAGAGERAFTLVELLVSMTVLLIIAVVLVQITGSTQRTWSRTTQQIEQFKDAREAFESVTRRLSQATLNTYWDYVRDANGVPTAYVRQSELRFLSGNLADYATDPGIQTNRPTHAVFFQAPLGQVSNSDNAGLDNLLNTWGYCVEFTGDQSSLPPFMLALPNQPAPHYRFRLMEFSQSSEAMSVYVNETNVAPSTYNDTTWFSTALGTAGASGRPVHVLATNVVALVLLPKLSPQDEAALPAPAGSPGTALSPTYDYSSTPPSSNPYNGPGAPPAADAAALNPKNQLPPVVQVTMVAVDESSYVRFQSSQANPATMPTSLGLSNLFKKAGSLTDPSVAPGYAADLQTLQNTLQASKLSYRVFSTAVSLKAAKWSRDQTN